MIEQGQMVSIRHRHYLVEDVSPFQSDSDQREYHKVNLECLDDDMLGSSFEVIWEHEPHPQVYTAIGFPKPESWDSYDRFRAFLYALEWTASSRLEGSEISAPFRAAIELEDYQLEPVVRALMMPRVNLLIADDVGLGKTIEAGLVAQELLSRQRIRRILIICPASLQRQWKEEMESKFQLTFEIIDSAAIQRLRKEYGIHVNPWSSYPRLITSLDFIKREQPLSLFRQSLQTGQSSLILKDWDLLIIDEAHNVAPSGRKTYVKDTDRTKAVREIVEHCEHRLFLTATPHNGYTESFTALLELLDPLRFSRGPIVDQEHRKTVMVRRLKDDIEDALGRKRFTTRKVIPLDIGELKEDEKRIHEYFEEYKRSRFNKVRGSELFPIKFTFTLLKKRLLSSPLAFSKSIETHINNLTKQKGEEFQGDLSLVKRLHASTLDDLDNDDEKTQREEDVIQESSKFFTYLTDRERWLLEQLQKLAQKRESQPDEKMNALLSWIEEKICPKGKWNNERLLIFTEYKDTLEYIENIFLNKGWKNRIIKLFGGMGGGEREEVKAAFQSSPEENSIRILIATDAASEGLNLQNYCRYLIHYEIPWNPNRMEQRNGRIDRHGQKAPEVFIHHFVYANNEDFDFLDKVVNKVQTMREDIGSVGEIIARQVEEVMLGLEENRQLDISDKQKIREKVREEIKADVITKNRVQELSRKLSLAQREWRLYPENLRLVLDEALKLQGHKGLEPITMGELAGRGYRLRTPLPVGWKDCEDTIKDSKNRLLNIIFDHELARDRRDVVLIHLNHPLMKRALSTFRSNLWSEGFKGDRYLNRVSYQVLPDHVLREPLVIAFGRIVAMSELGQKLHESLIKIGTEIDQRDLRQIGSNDFENLLNGKGEFSDIPTRIGDYLRSLFPFHDAQIQKMLKDVERSETRRVKKLLRAKAQEEAKDVRQLMRERIKEIEKRLEEARKVADTVTLRDFGFEIDEREQYEEDLKWLERKLEDLKRRENQEPERIQRKYELKSVRVFPVGILYLLPRKIVQDVG